MNKGISFQGLVPMRKESSESSEMVSQVLFGEELQILDAKTDWLLISLDFDGSQGWVYKDSIQRIASDNSGQNKSESGIRIVSHPLIRCLNLNQQQQRILPAGSVWSSVSKNLVTSHGKEFEISSDEGLVTPGPEVDVEEIGRGLLSLPYFPGGRCGFGFDSPGLVQTLCRMMGLQIPRTCTQQSELGIAVNFMHEVRTGDLAFFDNNEGHIDHVGMLLKGGRILHAYQEVRIDKFDQQGIFCSERDRYTHKLRIIKRI